MNIPVSSIIGKLEEELKKAKAAGTPHDLKARLLVIRSLCDVILDQQEENYDFSAIQEPKSESEITPLELEKMIGNANSKTLTMKERLLVEDDANGESIFDF
ncbi:YwdI family protein [Aeribacillus sp. FSL W8-0870]|uniref:YwdI family protein n=1 Tax=Aeribacillus sp. FSL W8-0870 TaxID=2954706 RepID=UPI0030CE088C